MNNAEYVCFGGRLEDLKLMLETLAAVTNVTC